MHHTRKQKRNGNLKTRKKQKDTHHNSFEAFEQQYEQKFKNNLTKHHNNVERELIKMFKTPFTPTKYKPQDDYYTYINYQWISQQTKKLKQKSEQKYYVQVDSFRVTQEKVYYELIDIVKEYIANNHTRKATAIRNVYQSLYHLDDSSAERFVEYYVKLTNKRLAQGNLYDVMCGQNRNEIISWGCPLVWTVMKDEKNVTRYKSTISAPQLTLYDYNIYIEDPKDTAENATYKRTFKRRYLEFIQTMFDQCLGAGHGLHASDVWDCEMDILTALGSNQLTNDDPDGHNLLTHAQAMQYGFDWNQFASKIGYKTPPASFICTSINYLKAILETLNKDDAWKSQKWKTYYLYIDFRQLMRFHHKWNQTHFEFHGKFVQGQQAPYPQDIYPVFGLSFCFNTFLTNEYIDRFKNQQHIDYTQHMASDLLTVFKRIIRRNTWLSPSTKRQALLKLEKIKLVIGSPKLMREDPLLDYDPKEAYQNMRKIAFWRTKQMIHLDGKFTEVDIPVIDWAAFKMVGKQSYVVNAYYTPTENSIYVPLAYLQKPFIDLDERGIEYNLAHIGYTLGHEMSHCLDDMGSRYDEKGNLHNWWTAKDRRKFNLKVADVIKQYETFAGYDGIHMDASLSTGENLADISGMAICEEYLKDFQEKNDDIVPIKALSFHAFFVYLAVQARQKIYNEAIKAQLKINPHPMDKYRTNCPLSRLELFRSLYNIKKGDKMYWPSTDTIW